MRFKVKVLTRSGGPREVEVEARDEADARRKASREGRIISVKKGAQARGGLSYADRQMFLSRLAAMLSSGIGAGESLKLIKATFKGKIKEAAHTLLVSVESGSTLPEAMELAGKGYFPETVAAMVKAGSLAGNTWKSLRDAMMFERDIMNIKKGASKGLWGAIGGFFSAAIFIIASVFWMMPKIMESDLMKMSGSGEDEMLQMTIEFSYWIGYAMAGITGLAFLFVFMGTVGRKIAPGFLDMVIMKIPIYRDFILSKNNYISFYALASLVGTGVRLEGAFALMQSITPAGILRDDFKRAQKAVSAGEPWAMVMKSLHPTDKAALSSSLDKQQVARAFDAMATFYRDSYAANTESFVGILRGISVLFITLSGLIMFGLTILPMLQMSSGIM